MWAGGPGLSQEPPQAIQDEGQEPHALGTAHVHTGKIYMAAALAPDAFLCLRLPTGLQPVVCLKNSGRWECPFPAPGHFF